MTDSLIGGLRSLRQIRGTVDLDRQVSCRGRSPFRERGCSDRAGPCWTDPPDMVKREAGHEAVAGLRKSGKTPRQACGVFSRPRRSYGIKSAATGCCCWSAHAFGPLETAQLNQKANVKQNG